MHFLFDNLFDWGPFGLGVPTLIAAGLTMLADEFKLFKAARICFFLAAIWTWGKVIMWGMFSSNNFTLRAFIAFCVFGVVGVGLVEALRLTTTREAQQEQGEKTASVESLSNQKLISDATYLATKIEELYTGWQEQTIAFGRARDERAKHGGNPPSMSQDPQYRIICVRTIQYYDNHYSADALKMRDKLLERLPPGSRNELMRFAFGDDPRVLTWKAGASTATTEPQNYKMVSDELLRLAGLLKQQSK